MSEMRTNGDLTHEVLRETVRDLKKTPHLVQAAEEFERYMIGNGTNDDRGDRYGIVMTFLTGLIHARPDLLLLIVRMAGLAHEFIPNAKAETDPLLQANVSGGH